jgi:hypothetical protein
MVALFVLNFSYACPEPVLNANWLYQKKDDQFFAPH